MKRTIYGDKCQFSNMSDCHINFFFFYKDKKKNNNQKQILQFRKSSSPVTIVCSVSIKVTTCVPLTRWETWPWQQQWEWFFLSGQSAESRDTPCEAWRSSVGGVWMLVIYYSLVFGRSALSLKKTSAHHYCIHTRTSAGAELSSNGGTCGCCVTAGLTNLSLKIQMSKLGLMW